MRNQHRSVPQAVVGRIELAIRFSTSHPFQQRAMWIAQELVVEFGEAIGRISLLPTPTTHFSIDCLGRIWDWRLEGILPDAERVKQLVRQKIDDQKIALDGPSTLPPSLTGARQTGERATTACL